MLLKTCSKCEAEKPFEDFTQDDTTYNGYDSSCIACRRKERVNERKALHRQKLKDYIGYIKKLGKCDCGEDHPAALDFHHVDESTKSFAISEAVSKRVSLKTLKEEMMKCILLCANCHRKHHHKERQQDNNLLPFSLKGRTGDFESFSPGSNPGRASILKSRDREA